MSERTEASDAAHMLGDEEVALLEQAVRKVPEQPDHLDADIRHHTADALNELRDAVSNLYAADGRVVRGSINL